MTNKIYNFVNISCMISAFNISSLTPCSVTKRYLVTHPNRNLLLPPDSGRYMTRQYQGIFSAGGCASSIRENTLGTRLIVIMLTFT
jgi:hypothetical protein